MSEAPAEPLIKRERREAVQILTINRPERRNALDAALRNALIAALDAAAGDASLRALVITGAGDKAFVAGADVREFADRSVAVAAARDVTRAALGLPLNAGLDLERAAFLACFGAADRVEGVRAFLEKRPPSFPGA